MAPRHRDTTTGGFALLAAAYTISQLGSAMSLIALPIIVFHLTGSAVYTGLLSVIEVLPFLLFGLVAGTIADRLPGLALPVATDLVSAVTFGTLALALAVSSPPVVVIYMAGLVCSVSFVFHSAPLPALKRLLVGKQGLVKASSVLQLGDTLAAIAGSALAALLLSLTSAALMIALDAASFLLSALLTLAIRARPPERAARPAAHGHARTHLSELKDGVRFFWETPNVRNTTIAGLCTVFSGGALLSLLTPFASQGLGAAAPGPAIPMLYLAGNLGSAAAAAMAPALSSRIAAGRLALAGLAVNGAAYALLLAMPTWRLALPFMALWQLTYTLMIVNNSNISQLITPQHLLGRVSATGRMLAWGGQPLGAATASALSALLSVRAGLAMCGVGVALGFAWAVMGRVSAIDVRPELAADEAPTPPVAVAAQTTVTEGN
jgi:hypothetical protein